MTAKNANEYKNAPFFNLAWSWFEHNGKSNYVWCFYRFTGFKKWSIIFSVQDLNYTIYKTVMKKKRKKLRPRPHATWQRQTFFQLRSLF